MDYPIISADSHITEPPNTYIDYIDPKWRDRAPQLREVEGKGAFFFIDGMQRPIAMGLIAAAGKPPEQLRQTGTPFGELHRGGWDPVARMADQKRDGVAAEVIYPSVGMMLCNHKDFDISSAIWGECSPRCKGVNGISPIRCYYSAGGRECVSCSFYLKKSGWGSCSNTYVAGRTYKKGINCCCT